MEPITTTLQLIPLPSGAAAAVVYSASFGDIVLALLLAVLVALQLIGLWRVRRVRL